MASGQLLTVRGAVACDDSSVQWVLPHEHLFHSIYAQLAVDADASATASSASASGGNGTNDDGTDTGIRPDQLHELRAGPALLGGRNLLLEREDEIFREVQALGQCLPGTGVIIDVTTASEGRNLAKLRRLSERVGLHIVASTSCDERYITSLPASMKHEEKSERIAKGMETELMFGVGETQSDGSVGIIYQQVHLRVFTMRPDIDGILAKVLALTQKNTGVPVFLSFSHDKSVFQSPDSIMAAITDWISTMISRGASPNRVVFCHADLWTESSAGVQFLVALAQRGIVLSFDLIGHYTVSDRVMINPSLAKIDATTGEPPRDSTIAQCVATLILDHGLGDRILVSSGVQQRIQLLRFGGGGYAYALHHFHHRLVHCHGVSSAQWEQLTRKTPLKLICWYTPPAAAAIPKHFLKCTICAQYFEPIVGEYFTKFQFVYCGTKCLRKHSKLGFKPLV